ncbi:hypothetical protein PENFLA_c014G04664 [Penicillium flavigenum]|uniref:Uncharacterized protein n=1 Tax=Penicillium flavigenum TaxID=254877 RepID=A0A1V6T6S7_9EURO|nr:hypothetical protein PENFLA_c014G04664 [Penicillium flavigenum]
MSNTRRALTTGANASPTNRKGDTSLHLATTNAENLSMVQSLLSAGGAVVKTIRAFDDVLIDTEIQATPLHQVERRLGFDKSNSLIAVVRHGVTSVEKGDSHILAIVRIADNYVVPGVKAGQTISIK